MSWKYEVSPVARTRSDTTNDTGPEAGSAAALFVLLWDTVANVLGTAATATLIARALKRALPSTPALGGMTITTRKFTYEYGLPDDWRAPDNAEAAAAFDRLLRELVPLLTALTGRVVVRQLARLEPFATKRLLRDEEPPL
jgi:hypothetical protein